MVSIGRMSSVSLLVTGLLGLAPPTTQSAPAVQPPPTTQAAPAKAAPAAAANPPSAGVIQTQETNTQGVVADVTECKRKDGVLTVKLRIRNTSGGTVSFYTDRLRDYDKVYLTADNKKYFALTDSEKQPLWGSTTGNESLSPGQSYRWWAKFPAPPAAAKSINLLTPVASPFDDVPISDQ
jgi:hypothetical protein